MDETRIGAQRVVIFGATSAIAADLARLYAERGARLFLIGRNADKLEALVAELGPAVVESRAVDLDDTAAAEGLVDGAWTALGDVDLAIVAQGCLGDQLATERDYAQAEAVIRTNFLSAVALLVPLANRFEKAGFGHIAVLSSVAGERGRPRNFTYGAAKAALNVYLQGLRTRLYSRGVEVHTIRLGPVDTPMTASHRKHPLFARSPAVAAAISRAIDRGWPAPYVPWFWRPIMCVVRNLPEWALQRLSFLSGR
ncbi:MAG TPA: SDR family NAD(P)-dependent oxidoreductase [Polyangia bacterium]|nr:SDR family NAD(P)-dependent oxidoreductase [Polyangia bacterium]